MVIRMYYNYEDGNKKEASIDKKSEDRYIVNLFYYGFFHKSYTCKTFHEAQSKALRFINSRA